MRGSTTEGTENPEERFTAEYAEGAEKTWTFVQNILFLCVSVSLWFIFFGADTGYAHHSEAGFFATQTSDVGREAENSAGLQAAYFRPNVGNSNGEWLDLTSGYARNITSNIRLGYQFHWVTDPAVGLNAGQSLFLENVFWIKHKLPRPDGFPLWPGYSLAVDLPTPHAIERLDARPGAKATLILSRRMVRGLTFAVNVDGLVEANYDCEGKSPGAAAPRRHIPANAATCVDGDPSAHLDWGIAVALKKDLIHNLDAGVEIAKEIDYPPGVTTLIGFYWTLADDWLLKWGVGFPTGRDEDFLSIRLGLQAAF